MAPGTDHPARIQFAQRVGQRADQLCRIERPGCHPPIVVPRRIRAYGAYGLGCVGGGGHGWQPFEGVGRILTVP